MSDAVSGVTNRDSDQNHATMHDEGDLRVVAYSILASMLGTPPTQDLLDYLAHIHPSSDSDLNSVGQAWQQIRLAAAESSIKSLDDEYHDLFIGLGRGEVLPYGSWHLAGFLMEQPLSDLRDDLKSLGIESDESIKEPEDHISTLCEAMALIIRAEDIDESRERQFFLRHIHSWAGKFFKELQSAKSAHFYKSVGCFGQRFVELENQYLAIQTH